MAKQKTPIKKAAKKKALKKSAPALPKKPISDHVQTLLAAASKKLQVGEMKNIILRKTRLAPDIEKFNKAIQAYPHLKGYEFHSFGDTGHLEKSDEPVKFCCPPRKVCDFYPLSECP